jgi:hypothetical protein
MSKIPPGRYLVVANSYGPNDQSPYDVQYYRSTSDARNAEALELGPGQCIQGIDFIVPRLAERTITVRVTWLDGRRAPEAHICVAYEHTENFARLTTASWIKDTGQNGFGVIHVFGDSRVRVFAAQYVDDEKHNRTDTYYSQTVESVASKIRDQLNLVLTSPKL